jgi:hypothetical protein
MALTVREVGDLTRILTRYPEWRAEMRRIVLSDELLSLPQALRELAAAQARTDEDVTEGAATLLREAPVAVVLDGYGEGWEKALAAAVA